MSATLFLREEVWRLRAPNTPLLPIRILHSVSKGEVFEMPIFEIPREITYTPRMTQRKKIAGDIGVIGLGVMGTNLARNIARKGFAVSVYNRTAEKTEDVIKKFGHEGLRGTRTIKELIASLQHPRIVVLMVAAGKPVDDVVEQLRPYLNKNDIIIDAGNSNFRDTIRRETALKSKGIHWVGMGVSGGEEGALNGPSIMVGGSAQAWNKIKPILTHIAAKDFAKNPCVAHVGEHGAGHFVKMVHNGIEYAEMQMIAELYAIMQTCHHAASDRAASGHAMNKKIAQAFYEINKGELKSYLLDITTKIFNKKDPMKKQGNIIDAILDRAGAKGTGKWTVESGLDTGAAIPSIAEAVFARSVSADKDIRIQIAQRMKSLKINVHGKNKRPPELNKKMIQDMRAALLGAKLSVYAQGFHLIAAGDGLYNFNINLAEVPRIWQGGCIIRSKLLPTIAAALTDKSSKINKPNSPTSHLFLNKKIIQKIAALESDWVRLINAVAENSVATPTLASALHYLFAIRTERLPANLIQAQRDYFGAHTFERIDKSGSFHIDWSSSKNAS